MRKRGNEEIALEGGHWGLRREMVEIWRFRYLERVWRGLVNSEKRAVF